ncbi:MAG: alanine--tRNA ligase [Flavobacteriales bacterium]|nr:alanine--tRNA ligase [Flavobacteriales bacterium]
MDAVAIRKTFLDFFREKAHEIVPSAPMVLKDDPTLMFTNAGMNPFKDVFLGNRPPKAPRVADTQKCLRVSGKHNDLEEVGVDTYHHTMFEMLGNWSFGDYFKQEAIDWAWELLTERYGIDKDRLYITVFEGDAQDGLPLDQEAIDIWRKHVPEERILKADKKDNFWEMGETGPCGPCSEIHVDIRSDEARAAVPGADLVNQDHPQVIEIWNLVFMQFMRKADQSLEPLPAQHIDTGMGFERLAAVLQGKQSNYDTDVFQPLIDTLCTASGKTYTGGDDKVNVALRVCADHVRAVAFSIADGQLPSNAGAGYVIRRILRRAVRYGYSFLELDTPFMHTLVPVLAAQMGDFFPELKQQGELIAKVIREEEESFLRTLDNGIGLLDERIGNGTTLSGADAFELYDTFGFPIDLTALICGEKGVEVDHVGFEAALTQQKERSRAAGKVDAGDWTVLEDDKVEEFVGYDRTEAEVRITRYREVKVKDKTRYQLVFHLTPFYPEGGGQVGDSGLLVHADGEKTPILTTRKENELILHITDRLPADLKGPFKAHVNTTKRRDTTLNHTATHLLHEALRDVLGTHVEQKGSLVKDAALRFDFSHFQKVSDEELREVEQRVNAAIRENRPRDERRNVPLEEARQAGAMMLFGEKYGDTVRMIGFGPSVELCGGTHVGATGEIGLFRISSEGAVAAGIRRIEAETGARAYDAITTERDILRRAGAALKQPADLVKAVEELKATVAGLQKEVEGHRKAQAGALKSTLLGEISRPGGPGTPGMLVKEVPLDAGGIKDIVFQLKAEAAPLFAVLGSKVGDKPTLTCLITEELAQEKDWNAGQMIRDLAKHIQGGGGGQAFFATAGGKNADGMEAALDAARATFNAS